MAVVLKLLLATLSHSLHYDRLLTATIIHANNDVLICGPNSSSFFFSVFSFMVCITGAYRAVTLVGAPKFFSVNVLGEFRHVNSSLVCCLLVQAKVA